MKGMSSFWLKIDFRTIQRLEKILRFLQIFVIFVKYCILYRIFQKTQIKIKLEKNNI